jgi:hypothetical protein
MHRGRPPEGLLMLREGSWMLAISFDAGLRTVQNDSLHPEWDDHAFETAHAGALATAA